MNLQGLSLGHKSSCLQFGWNVKNFAQNLLIIPGSTWKGGQSTVNLGRIRKDFGRITSDSVDPGWGGG